MLLGGYVHHAVNGANGRLRVFRKNADFQAFEAILAEGLERIDMWICGYCIMSTHWHLLLWPSEDAFNTPGEIGVEWLGRCSPSGYFVDRCHPLRG